MFGCGDGETLVSNSETTIDVVEVGGSSWSKKIGIVVVRQQICACSEDVKKT